jgi:hypothetical protein
MSDEQPAEAPAAALVDQPQPAPLHPADPEFAAVVDELRAAYRPGVPDDHVPPPVDQPAPLVGVVQTDGGTAVTYLAFCRPCADEHHTEPPIPIPFATEADRDRWAMGHADARQHDVTLAVQSRAGTTTVGTARPDVLFEPSDQQPEQPHRAAAKAPAAPVLAFVVPSGGRPDLLCRIPNRAGAAWLLTAAHACLLGQQGSGGITEPHRALYVGRIAEHPEVFEVRVDGVIGALVEAFGAPIGTYVTVARDTDLPGVEDAVEQAITDRFGLARHLFSVVLMADAPPADPPDAEADAYLRQRRADRARHEQRQAPPAP